MMSPEELEQTVLELKDKIDTILSTVDESEKEFQHKKGVEDFTSRNGETLGKYAETLKKLNGEDFDIFSSAYDEYNNDFSDIEEATYVTQLVSEIDNKIAQLKDALRDEEVEIKSDEETTEVKTDDETIETPAEEPKAEGEEEKPADEEDKSDEKSEEDELAEFEKELDEDYEKYHD